MSLADPGAAIGWLGALLFILVFFTGVWNTAVGSTGGVLFAVLAATLSPAVAIPVQSVVEGVSGIYRTWVLRTFIEWQFLRLFGAGSLPGFIVGMFTIQYLSELGDAAVVDNAFRLVVGAFILFTTWIPLGRHIARRREAPMAVGTITTFMSVFVGGMGAPISSALEGRSQKHAAVLATTSTAIVYQYLLRLLAFGLAGFSFAAYWPLILGLTIASLVGTWTGKHLLVKADPLRAKRLFRIVVTMIALSMIGRALWN